MRKANPADPSNFVVTSARLQDSEKFFVAISSMLNQHSFQNGFPLFVSRTTKIERTRNKYRAVFFPSLLSVLDALTITELYSDESIHTRAPFPCTTCTSHLAAWLQLPLSASKRTYRSSGYLSGRANEPRIEGLAKCGEILLMLMMPPLWSFHTHTHAHARTKSAPLVSMAAARPQALGLRRWTQRSPPHRSLPLLF